MWGRKEGRDEQNTAEKERVQLQAFSSNLCFTREEAADSEEIFGNMHGAR